MERVNKIFRHPLYQEHFCELQKYEENREFCNHTLEHFLDVARLMYIYDLENGAAFEKEIIYAAAFLHDIGRNLQYKNGIAHEKAGADLAELILSQCGFSDSETQLIRQAILTHRNSADHNTKEETLAGYLYRADKKSRNCFACVAFENCNWAAEKKNMEIDR